MLTHANRAAENNPGCNILVCLLSAFSTNCNVGCFGPNVGNKDFTIKFKHFTQALVSKETGLALAPEKEVQAEEVAAVREALQLGIREGYFSQYQVDGFMAHLGEAASSCLCSSEGVPSVPSPCRDGLRSLNVEEAHVQATSSQPAHSPRPQERRRPPLALLPQAATCWARVLRRGSLARGGAASWRLRRARRPACSGGDWGGWVHGRRAAGGGPGASIYSKLVQQLSASWLGARGHPSGAAKHAETRACASPHRPGNQSFRRNLNQIDQAS